MNPFKLLLILAMQLICVGCNSAFPENKSAKVENKNHQSQEKSCDTAHQKSVSSAGNATKNYKIVGE